MEDMRGFICDNCDELILYREFDINDDEDICFECHENRAENEALRNYRRYT
jgi:formylmethanofuran dehydrogenase subunit E